jgi:hypothetical protein
MADTDQIMAMRNAAEALRGGLLDIPCAMDYLAEHGVEASAALAEGLVRTADRLQAEAKRRVDAEGVPITRWAKPPLAIPHCSGSAIRVPGVLAEEKLAGLVGA